MSMYRLSDSAMVLQEPEQFSPLRSHCDVDLCDLLRTMNLDEKTHMARNASHSTSLVPGRSEHEDLVMEECHYQSDAGSECSASSSDSNLASRSFYGCAYLQAIQAQVENYPTTGGEYVEAIFTHREIFASHPAAHRDCSRAFRDIAGVLETRAWRADRDSDAEAVSTFRHEAWVVANALHH